VLRVDPDAHQQFYAIIANPDVKAKIAVTGFDAFTGPPETLAAFVQSELVNWAKLIKDAGIEPQ